MTDQALSDVKVVEWGSFISAPFCAKLMADMGAEVIKVEPPGTGDEARRNGPFPKDIPDQEKSGLFLYLNTNKYGVTANCIAPVAKSRPGSSPCANEGKRYHQYPPRATGAPPA